MRKLHPRDVAGRLVGIQHEARTVLERDRTLDERAEPKLWALQIDQYADGPAVTALDIADGRHQFAHLVMRGVAHIDAEQVGAGLEQAADHRTVGRRGAEGRENLDAAQASHFFVPGAGGRPDAPGGVPPGELGSPGNPPGPPGPTVPGIPGTRCEGCSFDSVSCTVQARCSPVSTSKKPVRSKPRARQFSVPLMVNSLSREHMKACPDHSPPRS